MCKIRGLMYATIAILVLPGMAQSDDLYLLTIGSESELQIVNQYVKCPIGMARISLSNLTGGIKQLQHLPLSR